MWSDGGLSLLRAWRSGPVKQSLGLPLTTAASFLRMRDWRRVCGCLWSRHLLQETTLRGLGMARPPPMLLGVSLHSSPGSPSFTRIPYQIGKLRQERENTCCLSLFTPAWEARRGCTHRKKIHLPIKLHECCDVNPPPSTNACSG